MTREENIAKLAQLRSEAEALVKDFNEATQNGNLADAAKAETALTEKINEYTATVREMCFEDCKNTDDPMLTAVKTLTFVTIGTKDEKKDDDKIPVRVIVEKEKPIDLLKLDKYCGGIGADKNWHHVAQKMNFLLTAQTCIDLGVDPKRVNDSYAMSEIARDLDMGKTPTSKTNMLKTLQSVVSAMIGDAYKATSHDVNFLLKVYARKARKALTVVCANHKYFRNYMAEICNHIVTGNPYGVDFKAKSEG